MKNQTRLPSAFAILLCASAWAAGCTTTRHDEPKAADKKPESVPAAVIVPMKETPAEAKAEVTLHVGDAAPELSFDEWIQGQEIHGIEAGKVHVVEFWATWCGPCVAGIPHLNAMQHEHPDVIFLGLAGSERAPKEGAADVRLENLRAFITKQGDQMTYRVAFDADRSMSRTWMTPAGQGFIPCAFLIGRDSRIAWIGNPKDLEAPLAQALATK